MRGNSAQVVVEWSPGLVRAINSSTRKVITGTSLIDLGDVGSQEIVVAVSRRTCFIKSISVPDISREAIRDALRLTLSQHVPIPATDASFDVRLTSKNGSEGRIVTLAAMRADGLRALHQEASAAGLRIRAVVPVAAGSSIVASEAGLSSGAILASGVEGLGVDIVEDGELRYSRALYLNGSSKSLSNELNRTFATADLPAVATIAAGIEIAEADRHVELDPLRALLGEGWLQNGFNLELPEVLAAREKAAGRTRVRFAGLILVAALLFAGLVATERIEAQDVVNKRRAQMENSLRKMRAQRDGLQAAVARERTVRTALGRAFQPAQTLGDVIAAASNATPPQVWLTGVNVDRGHSVLIRGTSMSSEAVGQYLDRLSQDPRFRDVKLVFANNAVIETSSVVQFSITAFPVGNLPLADAPGSKN